MRKKNKKIKFGDIVRIDLNEDDLYIVTLTKNKDIEYIDGSYVKLISKATEAEKQKLFKRLAKTGKRWNAEKKCLEDIKPAQKSEPDKSESEKVADSMLAMSQISKLMPHYGGAVTTKEWSDSTIKKYIIGRRDKDLYVQCAHKTYSFLAFHTSEQRDKFLAKNEELIKTYFMI